MSVGVKHNCYHLLIVEDRLEPLQVLRLEWHQDHECAGLVVRSRVIKGRLGVEEPHGGLVSNVVLVSSHWRIVQPEAQIKYSPIRLTFYHHSLPIPLFSVSRRRVFAGMAQLVSNVVVSTAILCWSSEKLAVTNKQPALCSCTKVISLPHTHWN